MKKAVLKALLLAMALLLLLGNAYADEQAQAVGILAFPTLPDFGTVTEGEIPTAGQTITVRSYQASEVTLNQPTAVNFTVSALNKTTLGFMETTTFTIAPAADLAPGTYSEKFLVTSTDGRCYATVTASVVVEPAPVYSFELLPRAVHLGELTVGYGEQTGTAVTIRNTGDQTLTFEKPVSSAFVFEGVEGLTLEPGQTADIKVSVAEGLAAGEYDEAITLEAAKASAVLRVYCVVKPVVVPRTGDSTPLAALFVLMLCGLTGMIIAGRKPRMTR